MNDLQNIIQELSVPLKTFRIFAIEKAIRSGRSPQLLDALKTRLETETDSECRMLIEHAIATISERLGAPRSEQLGYQSEAVLDAFAELKPVQQLEYIKNSPRDFWNPQSCEVKIRKAFKAKIHPVVAAEIVRKCQNFWPKGLSEFLEINLFSKSSVLQLACLEAVIQTEPEILYRNFEKIVLAKDPLIRALAIRGLARKDPVSAAEFLSECLRKGDHYNKLAALRVCSVMPFELIKSSILELVFTENDAKLLKIASTIIIANPDKEVPFRLCDQMVKSGEKRRKFLQDLLKKTCELIKFADICENFQQYFNSVKHYAVAARAKFFVLSCVELFNGAEEQTKRRIANEFARKASLPEIKEAVAELEKLNPGLLRDLMAAGLTITGDEQHEALKAARHGEELSQTAAKTEESPEKNLIRELSKIGELPPEAADKKIESALRSQNPELIAAAFRAGVACKHNKWVSLANSFLKNENDEIVASAIDYLAEKDTESFLLQFRTLINSKSILVRTALLRNICRVAPDVAREILISMLNDNSESVRERALGSVIHFEFASIREILTSYLRKESREKLIVSCIAFYLANPAVENVYDLHLLSRRKDHGKLFAQAKESLVEILDELNISNPEETHRFIQEKEEQQKSADIPQAEEKRKFKDIKEKVNWGGISEKISDIGSTIVALKKILIFALLVSVTFLYLTREAPEETKKPVTSRPLASTMQNYVVVVQKIDSADGSLFATTADKKFIRAIPRPGKIFLLEPGDKIRLRALPFKVAPDGTTIVKTISLAKEK
ncbi:MAG: hypothetical protein Kow0029_24990 [Candidatus Rifleibacteriota bacterium]